MKTSRAWKPGWLSSGPAQLTLENSCWISSPANQKKTNMALENHHFYNRKYIFKCLAFHCHVRFPEVCFLKKTYLHPWPLVLGYFCCSGISSRGGLGQPCFVMNLGIMSESKSHHRLKGENISENTSVDFITISFPNSHVELPPWKSIVRQKISKLLGGLDV